jgi:hypothetical protein
LNPGSRRTFMPPVHCHRGASRACWGFKPEVDGIHEHLHMSLGLHESAHDAEGAYRLSVFCQEARDDGVVRALARCQDIRMAGIKGKTVPTVVQWQYRYQVPQHRNQNPCSCSGCKKSWCHRRRRRIDTQYRQAKVFLHAAIFGPGSYLTSRAAM